MCEQVAVVVHGQLAREQVGVGPVADGDEEAGDGQLPQVAGRRVAQPDAGDGLLTEDVVDDAVPGELDLRVLEGPVLHDLRCPQLVASVDDRDFAGELGEERGLLEGGVTAADDGDLLVAEEEAVAGGAGGESVADEPLLGLEAEHDRPGAGRDDDGVGRVGGFGGVGVADPDADRGGRQIDAAGLDGLDLGAEADGLCAHVGHERRTHHALGEAGEVLDVGREHQLAAGLVRVGGRLALEDQRRQVGAGRVDGGGESGGAGADDDDFVVGGGHGGSWRPGERGRGRGWGWSVGVGLAA